jgi:large subunit ribosomal protein L5
MAFAQHALSTGGPRTPANKGASIARCGDSQLLKPVAFMTQRLRNLYNTRIVPKLMGEFDYKNKLQVTRIQKIVINRGLGDASQNAKILESSLKELSLIAGQKGVITRSKKAIAGFKLRQKNPVGITVTLRGERMYSFLDRLINLALPRIRDFQGVSPRSVDGHGNYSLGLEEQLMFPEIDYDKIDQIRGMDISIVTTSQNDAECLSLLKEFGMPFKKV